MFCVQSFDRLKLSHRLRFGISSLLAKEIDNFDLRRKSKLGSELRFVTHVIVVYFELGKPVVVDDGGGFEGDVMEIISKQ